MLLVDIHDGLSVHAPTEGRGDHRAGAGAGDEIEMIAEHERGIVRVFAKQRLHAQKVLIGALCAATLEIARAGLTAGVRHTSNSKAYLQKKVPGYRDEAFYVDELAATEHQIITASGLGSVEFAREVIRELGIYSEADTQMWFDMFKKGLLPRSLR